MVTAATLHKRLHFDTPSRLDLLQKLLLGALQDGGWKPQAWAVFPNHYHVVVLKPSDADDLKTVISKVHTLSASEVNREDGTPNRQIWFQYWDSAITWRQSYFARLRYVHENAVHHNVVPCAENYAWCSAGWLARHADPAYRKLLESFKIDQLRVYDDF